MNNSGGTRGGTVERASGKPALRLNPKGTHIEKEYTPSALSDHAANCCPDHVHVAMEVDSLQRSRICECE